MLQKLEMEWGELEQELEGEILSELEGELEQEWESVVRMPPLRVTVRPFRILDRFQHDRSSLMPFHMPIILRIARHVVARWGSGLPITMIRLVGHTDTTGSASYNLGLGKRRALAVQAALIREIDRLKPGLSKRIRFVVQSLGESRPRVRFAKTPAERSRNRRVGLFLTAGPAPPKPRPADPGLAICLRECRREFERCRETRPLVQCRRALKRCERECRGIPV